MTTTMTWVGLDVHARSTHAAAIDRENGELRRARFGAGVEEVICWLRALPQPVHGCYEAGPTGYALYRAAEAAGLRVDVVAPSKTPRAASDRIQPDLEDNACSRDAVRPNARGSGQRPSNGGLLGVPEADTLAREQRARVSRADQSADVVRR